MQIACYKETAWRWFFFLFFLASRCSKNHLWFSLIWYLRFRLSIAGCSLICTLDVHDGPSVVVIGQSDHDSSWWSTLEQSSLMKHRQSDIFLQMRRQQLLLKRQVFNIFQSNFLKNLISLPHQVTHTRFLTITLYQCFCCLLLEIYLFPHLLCQPIIVFGLLNDVFFEYLHLLYRSVSVHLDSL